MSCDTTCAVGVLGTVATLQLLWQPNVLFGCFCWLFSSWRLVGHVSKELGGKRALGKCLKGLVLYVLHVGDFGSC